MIAAFRLRLMLGRMVHRPSAAARPLDLPFIPDGIATPGATEPT